MLSNPSSAILFAGLGAALCVAIWRLLRLFRPKPDDLALIESFAEAQGAQLVDYNREFIGAFRLPSFDFEGEPADRDGPVYKLEMRTPFGNAQRMRVTIKRTLGSGRVVRLS